MNISLNVSAESVEELLKVFAALAPPRPQEASKHIRVPAKEADETLAEDAAKEVEAVPMTAPARKLLEGKVGPEEADKVGRMILADTGGVKVTKPMAEKAIAPSPEQGEAGPRGQGPGTEGPRQEVEEDIRPRPGAPEPSKAAPQFDLDFGRAVGVSGAGGVPPETEPEPAPESEFTLSDAQAALVELNNAKGFDLAVSMLGRYNVKRVRDLHREDYSNFIEDCKAEVK